MTTNQKISLELISDAKDFKCKESKLVINRKTFRDKDNIILTGMDAESVFDLVRDLIEISKNQSKEGDKNGRDKSL